VLCVEMFTSLQEVIIHLRQHSEQEANIETLNNTKKSSSLVGLRHDKTKKTFPGFKFKRKSKDIHNESRLQNENVEKTYQCSVCKMIFAESGSIESHMKNHIVATPYSCNQCGLGFAMLSDLAVHTKSHTEERLYSCSKCDQRFTASNRFRHHRNIHKAYKVKPYKCGKCAMEFAESDAFKEHLDKIHEVEKTHRCSICSDRRFAQYSYLTSHMRAFHCHVDSLRDRP